MQGGNTSALVVLREFSLAKARLGPQWGIEVTQMRVTGFEGQQSQFTLLAPGAEPGIQLQREFEKSTVCDGTSRQTNTDPSHGNKTRIDFVVSLKKKAPGG
jgi:hypothetical protein